MVKVFIGTDHEYYMDGYLKTNLDTAKKVIKEDWDMMFVYDGAEGAGKSTKAIQDAYYCDPTLTLDRVAFTPFTFRDAILSAKKYQAVVYDEAYSGLSSRGAMSLVNKSLISMLTEIRQKNLFVFIVLPCYFDLDKYVALWRSRLLIHVYTGKGFKRGFFKFYNIERKKDMYMLGKKLYEYRKGKPNFKGRFTKYFPLDMDEYRKLKAKALKDRGKGVMSKEVQKIAQEAMFKVIQERDLGLTKDQKLGLLNMKHATYYLRLEQYKKDRKHK